MFNNFAYDKRFLYIILAIFVVMNIGSYINNPNSLLTLVLSLPGVLIAITFHEFAHAFAADKLGDDTPRLQGRLTLNPLAHLDPIGSLMLVFAGIGWGKPVEINPRNFNRDKSMNTSEIIVSIAGPLMNFFLAIVFAIILGLTLNFTNSYIQISELGMSVATANQATSIIVQILIMCVTINLGLGIFNLIPLPPLDGSKILRNILPYNAREWFDRYYQILYIIFIVIWITPVARTIISPLISLSSEGILKLILGLFGRVL